MNKLIYKALLSCCVLFMITGCSNDDSQPLNGIADRQQLQSKRGSITDRNGVVLAEDMDSSDIPVSHAYITEHGGRGTNSVRYYPYGALMAHVVGSVDETGAGRSGVEKSLDEFLTASTGVNVENAEIIEINGATVALTLDSRLQRVTEISVEKMCADFDAKAGWAIVQNVRTGEILAMASYPTFDLSRPDTAPSDWCLNRSISYAYEPGSILKAGVIASALENGVINESDSIDCEQGKWAYGGMKIYDSHAQGTIPVSDVIKFSSNIGTAKIALKMGETQLYDSIKAFQFGDNMGIEVPGEVSGVLYPPANWSEYSVTRIGMGHEVAATSLQVLSMMSTIANDGIQLKPQVIKEVTASDGTVLMEFEPLELGRPISPETARIMRQLLVSVTEDGGTGTKAHVEGFQVAGKTGTAQKIKPLEEGGGYYPYRFISSFAGFIPADKPEISIIVVADDPGKFTESGRKIKYYGGTVCAPTFSEIAEFAMKEL